MNRGFAALVLFCCALGAQETGGSLSGRVVDGSGAAIPGAAITLTQLDTGAVREAAASDEGVFTFPGLPVGRYELTAVHPGFKKHIRRHLELNVSQRLGVEIRLEVGEVAQEVTVESAAETVETESASQGGTISGEQVRELQLNGRSFLTLLELVPGVSSNMADRMDPNSAPDVSINGARSSASNFNIDGGNNADVVVGSSSMNTFTSVETIAEFTVLTSTFSAEYGRGGFSQVNVVTRGGTRQFRGSLFHFFRNDALDARDYFSHQVLPLKLNNFGYTLSGPVSFGRYNRERKKTFFFFAQEFNYISTRGEAVNTTVPTAAEKAGDFSAYGNAVIDPTTGQPFPNGRIPANRMDPNATKLLTLYPLPNFVGPGQINYTSAAASRQEWREEMIRIDHNFARGLKVFGRYTVDSAFVRNPYGGSGITSITTRWPGIATTISDRPGKNLVVNGNSVHGPSLLNQFGFTYARRFFDMQAVNDSVTRAALGLTIPELFPENDGDIPPSVSFGSNYGQLNIPRRGHKELFNTEFTDNLTRIAGAHTFKFGGVYSYGGNREQPFSPNTAGSLSYTTNNARHPVANFLLNLPFSYTEVEKTTWSDARFGMLEAYAQDDWRVHPRLMLNVGLRWSNFYNPHDRNNTLSNFTPDLYSLSRAPRINPANGQMVSGTGDPLNGIMVAGSTSPYGRRVTENGTNLWAPRIGFAWSPFGRRTAIRGGWGMYYTRPLIGTFVNNSFDNPPFSRTVTLNNPRLGDNISGTEAPVAPPSLTALGLPLKTPTIHQWSFGVDHEVMRNTVLKVNYVASRGLRLLRPLSINNPDAGAAAAAGTHVNFVRPFHGWGAITERQSSGSSVFHSLQVSFNQRLRGKLTAGVAYTYGKSIDDGSSDRASGDLPPNARNIRAERAPSDFDRTQILTANFLWSVPGFRRNRIMSGWQLSGIARMWTGRPMDVTLSADVAGIGATQNQRPNVIADTQGPRTVEEWFNRAAFARPATGTFGNLGRNSLRGPGVNKWDLSLNKTFALGERTRLTFRWELFNVFNHPSFTTIGTALNTTATGVNPGLNSFGVVTGTRDARVMQLALKLNF